MSALQPSRSMGLLRTHSYPVLPTCKSEAALASFSNPVELTQEEMVSLFKEGDRPYLQARLVPEEIEAALDKAFAQPCPKIGDIQLCTVLNKRGVKILKPAGKAHGVGPGVQFGRTGIALIGSDILIKFQGDDDALSEKPGEILLTVHINDGIRECIAQRNLQQITCVDKWLYILPKDPFSQGKRSLSDRNVVVVARSQPSLEPVYTDDLTLDQYRELTELVASVRIAPKNPKWDLFWKMEDGRRKMVFLTDSGTSRTLYFSDEQLHTLCTTPEIAHGDRVASAIVKEATKLLRCDLLAARKIMEFFLVYHYGLGPLEPKQPERRPIFDEAVSAIMQEVQRICDGSSYQKDLDLIRKIGDYLEVYEDRHDQFPSRILAATAASYKTMLRHIQKRHTDPDILREITFLQIGCDRLIRFSDLAT